jgi:hypothetical protein
MNSLFEDRNLWLLKLDAKIGSVVNFGAEKIEGQLFVLSLNLLTISLRRDDAPHCIESFDKVQSNHKSPRGLEILSQLS